MTSTRTKICLLFLAAIGFASVRVALAEPTEALQNESATPDVANLPATALWWVRGQNGNFWSIDVGPGGYAFVQLSTFDEQRRPIFLTMQGQLEAAAAAQIEEGFQLRLGSLLYQLDGGRCLGCPSTQARVSASRFGEAELLFRNATQAEFRWNDRRFEIERFPLYNRAEDGLAQRLGGRYLVSWLSPNGAREALAVDVVPAVPPLSGWHMRPYGDFGNGLYQPSPGFEDFLHQLLAVQLDVDPGSDRLISGFRRSDDFLACGRVCACPQGYVQGFFFPNRCVPIDFAQRELIPVRASERNGVLVLDGNPDPGDASADFGSWRLQPIDTDESIAQLPRQFSEPDRGLWWETGVNGQFWSIDVGPGGYLFVNYATFDAAGRPTFLTMQGQYQSVASAQPGGVIGQLSSPLYRLSEGQCLSCDFAPAQVAISEFGLARIEFHSSQRAEFIWNDQRIAIARFPLYNRTQDLPAQRLAGRYNVVTGAGYSVLWMAIELEPIAGACPASVAGTTVLGLRCLSCRPGFAAPGPLQALLAGLEIHAAPTPYTELAAFSSGDGCRPFGRFDERQAQLQLSPIAGGSDRYYRFIPMPEGSNSVP